ncbi:MAG: protein YgfX [Gammaproteobacteria bacterium]
MRGFDGPIHIALCRSRLLVRGVLLAHGLALILLVWVMPHSVGLVVLLCAIAANAGCTVRSLHRRGAGDVRAILFTARGRWQLTLRDGRNLAAVPARAPLVSAGLIALSLRCADRRIRHVVLLADNAPSEPCRRLRVRLLHGADAGAMERLPGR